MEKEMKPERQESGLGEVMASDTDGERIKREGSADGERDEQRDRRVREEDSLRGWKRTQGEMSEQREEGMSSDVWTSEGGREGGREWIRKASGQDDLIKKCCITGEST